MTDIPALSDLMNNLLDSFANSPELDANYSEIEPYDASAGIRIDPISAWNEVLTIAKIYGINLKADSIPSDWSTQAFADQTTIGLPCACGYFPQQMNDVPRLLKTVQLRQFPKVPVYTLSQMQADQLKKMSGDQALLAVGIARMAGAFDLAQELLNRCPGLEPWVRANEAASILWVKGDRAEALQVWKVQAPNSIILLNRGMAKLFFGDKVSAKVDLQQAAAGLSDSSGWKHLVQLYISLCSM